MENLLLTTKRTQEDFLEEKKSKLTIFGALSKIKKLNIF